MILFFCWHVLIATLPFISLLSLLHFLLLFILFGLFFYGCFSANLFLIRPTATSLFPSFYAIEFLFHFIFAFYDARSLYNFFQRLLTSFFFYVRLILQGFPNFFSFIFFLTVFNFWSKSRKMCRQKTCSLHFRSTNLYLCFLFGNSSRIKSLFLF